MYIFCRTFDINFIFINCSSKQVKFVEMQHKIAATCFADGDVDDASVQWRQILRLYSKHVRQFVSLAVSYISF